QYSAPKAQVNSLSSSPKPSGASPKDLKRPEVQLVSLYFLLLADTSSGVITPSLFKSSGTWRDGTNNLVNSICVAILLCSSKMKSNPPPNLKFDGKKSSCPSA